ncbi:hypothetical protein M231_00855 [Tremella mesenterica]|uniref:Uncharacterized protein n=1 Tax=Tremella mesenterica TaxID=5217 RepID=A0A4Q1BV25_TREME|nr:hypothetical protein M231_00855 [Tremella mesenterica]
MPVNCKHTPYPSKKRVRFTSPIVISDSESDSNSVISSTNPKSDCSAVSYDTSITTTPTTSNKPRTYARRSDLEINAMLTIIVNRLLYKDITNDTLVQVGPEKKPYGYLIQKYPQFDVRLLYPTSEDTTPLTTGNVSTLETDSTQVPTAPSVHYSTHSIPTMIFEEEDSLSPLDSISNISVQSHLSVHSVGSEISIPRTEIHPETPEYPFNIPPGVRMLSAEELLHILHPRIDFILPVNTAYRFYNPDGKPFMIVCLGE